MVEVLQVRGYDEIVGARVAFRVVAGHYGASAEG